jgi:hypothetical protein
VLNVNTSDDTLGPGAGRKILVECLAGLIRLSARNHEAIMDTDPSDLEDAIDIFNIPLHMSLVTIFGGGNILLGQKTGQGPHHSASNTTYDVVKGCRMFLFRFTLVKSLNSPVHTIEYRFLESLDEGLAN